MFFISNVKRYFVFVNWKRKTPREEFEPNRNLSCDSTKYIFSVTIKTTSRHDYCCYPTKVCRTYIMYM